MPRDLKKRLLQIPPGWVDTQLGKEAHDRIVELEEALAPFAKQADGRKSKKIGGSVCFGQIILIKARKALKGY